MAHLRFNYSGTIIIKLAFLAQFAKCCDLAPRLPVDNARRLEEMETGRSKASANGGRA
jgi:hypothetical protein